VHFFTNKYSRQLNKPVLRISDATMNVLCCYAWPGNIRELEHIIERCAILSSGETLELDESRLGAPIPRPPHDTTLEDADRELIRQALIQCQWVIGGASGGAAKLGMKRTSLQYKMQKLGITRRRAKLPFTSSCDGLPAMLTALWHRTPAQVLPAESLLIGQRPI
jgi:formate hydrogenlyase transcriptional activator